MPDHQTKVTGEISHIFAHRFVVQGAGKAVLCDLTPHGIQKIRLQVGDRVTLEGEMKPSELKVARLSRNGEKAVEIDHHKDKEHDLQPADPKVAFSAAETAGFKTFGASRRKPKHFEVLARRDEEWVELHIELDGHIRKVKPDFDREKWGATLPTA